MKLIRLTDDRFVLDAGPDLRREQADQLVDHWKTWWATRGEDGLPPGAFVIGGHEIPVEYEDRREPDIESRLRALEAHTHRVIVDEDLRRVTTPPTGPEDPRD